MDFKQFATFVREGRMDALPKLHFPQVSDGYRRPNVVAQVPTKEEKSKKSTDYVQDAVKKQNIFKNDVKSNISWLSQVDDVTLTDKMDDELFEHCRKVYREYKFEDNISKLRVHKLKDQIVNTIFSNRVTIIEGQTGCGKTTQIPQFILDSCRQRNIYSNIIVTQPRRIAAISIARRICEERNWPIGSVVGYKVSLDKEVSPDTRLTYCTAGILLELLVRKKSSHVPFSHIFIDEVHERNDETDFLLIVIKMLLARNPKVKVILMSATIDTKKFVDYFSDPHLDPKGVVHRPPVVSVEQTTQFRVDTYTLDSFKDLKVLGVQSLNMDFNDPKITNDQYKMAANLIQQFYKLDEGEEKKRGANAVLVFLPGLYEIETMQQDLEKKNESLTNEKWIVCPLHSKIAFEDQIKVFKPAPDGKRKIILATNIAESSLTVPDVKYVIDFCLTKSQVQKDYTNYLSLELGWISKSQAAQRAGRVGRVSSGRVYRLVPQSIYDQFHDNCTPEILKCPLETLVLKTKQLDLGSPAVILAHAMDPPDLENINRTVAILKEIGALRLTTNGVYQEDDGDLTSIGLVMANLPLDPAASKIIIIGLLFDCINDSIIMACAMSVKNLFSQPLNKEMEAYNSKFDFSRNSFSDPIAFLSVYKIWKEHHATGRFKQNKQKIGFTEWTWCQRHFIQLRSLKEVQRLEDEIKMRLINLNINVSGKKQRILKEEKEAPLILKIVLAGASYPNYFLKSSINEVEAVKEVGGHNPCTTVYLKNFPTSQPKHLYVDAIKKHFLKCTSDEKDIKILFDGSNKIFVQFQNTSISCQENGFPMMPLYRAIKMFQLKSNIEIPLLPLEEARSKAKEIFGEDFEDTLKSPLGAEKFSTLPGLGTSVMTVYITEIIDPNDFWIQPTSVGKRLSYIVELMQDPKLIEKVQNGSLKVGDLCVAPYMEQGEEALYRAKVLSVEGSNPRRIRVFFIDYGNTNYLSENQIFTFTKLGISKGLKTEPPLALHCSLAKIQPSFSEHPDCIWSHKAKSYFIDQFSNKKASLKIYSVLDTTMNVYLYKYNESSDLNEQDSFNNFLISKGVAELAEEPYLSQENNMMRKNVEETLERGSYSSNHAPPNTERELPDLDNFSSKKARLRGPYSPLEMVWNGVSAKNLSLKVHIDKNSVNSVLLDDKAMDCHERFLVAGSISQGNTNKVITLRNTTLMPNIRGLFYICSMIFAPRVELRHDLNRQRYVGALCGLGYEEETKKAYFPENDLELKFDTEIDNDDIEDINRIRLAINYAVNGDEEKPTCFLNEMRVMKAKKDINIHIMKLVKKSRKSISFNDYCPSSYCWGEGFDPKHFLKMNIDNNESFILPLILGINLDQTRSEDRLNTIVRNLEMINLHVKGTQTMRTPVKCELCNDIFGTVKSLKMHVMANRHEENKQNFFSNNRIGSKERLNTIVQNLEMIDHLVKGAQTMETSVKCELCNEIFKTFKSLEMHVSANIHKKNQQNFFRINFDQTRSEYRLNTTLQNLEMIEYLVKGRQMMISPVKCELCNEICETVKLLKMHVSAKRHKENYENFFTHTKE